MLHTTALNLGLTEVKDSNMPSLVQTLLPMQGSAGVRGSRAAQRKLTALLLDPPSRGTAELIQNAIRCALLHRNCSMFVRQSLTGLRFVSLQPFLRVLLT